MVDVSAMFDDQRVVLELVALNVNDMNMGDVM
jgi:hypothetical protein